MNRQEELLTIHFEVAKAIEELTQNRDCYAAVSRLAAALEMVLNYLEGEDQSKLGLSMRSKNKPIS